MNSGTAIRYYGRRKGKPLKASRQSLLETVLPQLRIALPTDARDLDPAAFFPSEVSTISLEIGFGSGEHLAAMAAANPEDGFVGSEVFLNGVASMTRHISTQNLTNVRIFDEDARYLLPALKSASLYRIFLLFPDPWPKSRHAKRRLISPKMLDELARLLVDGGEFRVASDHPVYVRWALLHGTTHGAFEWTAKGPECWQERPADSVASRYEEKARKNGRSPTFLSFKRRPRPSVS